MELKDLNLSASDREYIDLVKNKIKCLTSQEEKELLLRYNDGNFDARQKLIEGNLYIVINCALKYVELGMPFDELVQEGNIVLMKCIDQFDITKDIRLTSFAYFCVNRKMTMKFLEKNYGSSYEENSKLAYNIYKTIYQYYNEFGEEPSDLIIADTLGIDIVKVKEIKKHKRRMESLDEILKTNNIYDNGQDMFDDMSDYGFKNTFICCLSEATPKQREVIKYHLGLVDGKLYSFKSLEKILGITYQAATERYHNGMARVLRKLKSIDPESYEEYRKERTLIKKNKYYYNN